MFTRVARGTTTRSAPMREKLVAMPSRSAQPATKLAKADADAEHHGRAEKDRPQSAAADVLRGQPDQQPKIMPAMGHLAPGA